jgi:epidermal growth factor receptor substrate 15
LEIERKVDAAEDYTALKITDLQGGRYDVIQEQKRQVNDVELAYRTKSEEDALAARANNEELIEVQRSTISHEKEISDLNTVHAFKTDGEIAAVRRKVLDDDTDFAKIRKEATIQLKDIQRDKLEMDRLAFNGETEKVLESQAILNAESAKRNSISIKADAAMVDKVAALERSEQKAYAVTSQGQMSDEDERLNMHQRVGLAELSVQEKAEQDKAQRKKNTQELADLSKTRSKQTQLEEEAQRKKALDAQGKLDNITDTPPKKVKVRNALGDEYPEGVSEESFKQSDEVGLVKTIITRRVVVIDGHADVYIRTQSLNGITYSKNGSPSLSNVWNQETQDPKLERHY